MLHKLYTGRIYSMNRKEFRRTAAIITMAMVATVGWSVAIGNAIVPIVAVTMGLALLYFFRSRVTQVIEDERIYKIGEKASYITLRVFAVITALTGAVLIALSRSGLVDFEQAGVTLAFAACASMVLYIIFYGYYDKKYGD